MLKIKLIQLSLVLLLTGIAFGKDSTLINTSHLDHLYEEIEMNGERVGIIHIYSEYPDYKWVGDDDEGIACVDDAARAAIFYLRYSRLTGEDEHLQKAKMLINFLLKMQSENGFFYNFIWKYGTINKTFRTSVAEPNWWSWRALWALGEAVNHFDKEQVFYIKILDALSKGVKATKPWIIKEKSYKEYGGFKLPSWLPYESASDQAAVIIKAMLLYSDASKDTSIVPLLRMLCDGVVEMQAGDSSTIPYYAFFSWQNTWHAWGNSQADALLYASKFLGDESYIRHALNECKYFYPYLIKENYYSDFTIEKNNKNEMSKSSKFSQIAYGIRPIVFASANAFEITGDTTYANTAIDAAGWLCGKNIVKQNMYDIKTGRCYDGIVSAEKINYNSGAESTIEALLTLLRIEENKTLKEMLHKRFYN